MNIDGIKATWRGYSTRRKWIIGGVAALVVVGAAGAGQNGDRGGSPYAQGRTQGSAPGYGGQGYDGQGYGGQGQGGQGQGGQEQGGMSAGYAGAAPGGGYAGAEPAGATGDEPDVMSGWQHREHENDITARGFDQYIRDETDVKDATTGEITTDVPNDVANPAIESGAATVAPPAEVSPEPAAPASDPE